MTNQQKTGKLRNEGTNLKSCLVPIIDPDDFKKIWEVRRVCFGGYIDVDSLKPLCKPDTDVEAAITRATLLLLLTQKFPGELSEFMEHGQPSDAFVTTFAQTPLAAGGTFDLGELIEFIRKPQLGS